MAQATVKTVQYIDPRIEPQPDPVYDHVIGPTQNQYYKIAASGLSNSNITFNNLTTLGVDRAYLDTFEIELQATFTFKLKELEDATGAPDVTNISDSNAAAALQPNSFVFQSWPFNTCCEQAHVNINGGAFFSQPLSYIRAKERYMNQRTLSDCYENVCPCHRPYCQYESTNEFWGTGVGGNFQDQVMTQDGMVTKFSLTGSRNPSRYGIAKLSMMPSEGGLSGGSNNDFIHLGDLKHVGTTDWYENLYYNAANHEIIMKVQWREPLFVSPFSSKYDATYGRPLYNITSMDISFTLMNLGNMIRMVRTAPPYLEASATSPVPFVESYSVNIDHAALCYQVMTIPNVLNKPLTTLVPYRRFVPYITDYNQSLSSQSVTREIDPNGQQNVTFVSGVYTFNEIPTAIWLFVAPSKERYQNNDADYGVTLSTRAANMISAVGATKTAYRKNPLALPSWDSNKLFAFIRKVDLSLANTTQILATAEVHDLYRIAKANGCQDSFTSWAREHPFNSYGCAKDKVVTTTASVSPTSTYVTSAPGAGSVLRLKPGVDLVIPDQALIPGANGNNMVFQARVTCDIPKHSYAQNNYSLWLLFEYVGVAAISPGQCEITMNPLGSGEIMAASPIVSATSEGTEGTLEGSGFWDGVKKASQIAAHIADGNISRYLTKVADVVGKVAPGVGNKIRGYANDAAAHGLGEPASKRGRGVGGAIMGHGLNDWV